MGFRFLLDLGLHVADVTEAPAARDVDGVAPLVTPEGRWAATWAASGNLQGCRASSKRPFVERISISASRLWSGYVTQSHSMPLALVSGIMEAESQLVKQLL